MSAGVGDFDTGPRFELRALLGRGAHGVVYRALDHDTGREVALKAISSPDADQVYHLKQEFRALASLTHPNLVQLESLVASEQACFFSMELLEGRTFTEHARELCEGGWTDEALERLEDAALQLASGVAALHAAGKLHRDIKPGNVIVTNDGRAVLVDFGLCTDIRLVERAKNPLVGTLLYMSPEQAWGKPLGPAADWYAVGALLYEAIVQRRPFEGEGTSLLFAKDKVPAVPEDLPARGTRMAELAVALLDPDPADRPPAAAILHALREGADLTPSPAALFVGRSAELGVLETALRDVQEGRPAVVDVEGPSGIGKSELVERFLESLEERQAVVLRGRCHPQESVSYNGFDGIVDALSEWLIEQPEAAARALAPHEAASGSLLALFPVLGRITWLGEKAAATEDHFAVRRRAFGALRELLARIGERHAVALWLDDAQWGGADTAALLANVFRPAGAPRVLLVLSYRTEDQNASTLLTMLRSRAAGLLDSVHHVTLGPLGTDESRELASHVLGEHAAEGAAEHVASEAGGHPFYVRELAFARAAERREPSGDLRTLLRGRIENLDRTERTLLELAATAGRPLAHRVLFAALKRSAERRPHVLRLARQRLVRETEIAGERALEPYHAHVREAVLASVSGQQRRARHRALADALLEEKEPDADVLVDHLIGAGDRASAQKFAEIAADRASRALAFDRAVQLYRLAIDLRDGARADLRVRLASTLESAGRSREAAEAYADAARDAANEGLPIAADLERRAAEQFLRGGHFDEGIRRLRRVLEAADVPYPASPIVAFGTFMAIRTKLAVRGLAFRQRREADLPPSLLAQADACWSAGIGLAWVDRTRTAVFQARHMMLALEAGEPTRVARALATEASQLACLGGEKRTRRGRAIMADALKMTADAAPPTRAFALLMAGTLEFYASRYRDSLTLCEKAEGILRQAHSRSEWELMTGHTLTLAALAYLGETRLLRQRQRELLAEARDRGNILANVCLASGPANLGWLAADDPDEARRRTEDAISPWKADDFQLPHYLHLVATAQIALYEGNPIAAWDRLAAEWPRVRSSMSLHVQNFRVTLLSLRARAAAALARTEAAKDSRAKLLRAARSDAKQLASEDVEWALPLGLSIEASVAAVCGDVELATTQLARAADGYRAIGMALHGAAADHERGRLLGGDDGRALLRKAEAWMIDQRIVNPERLASTLIVGV